MPFLPIDLFSQNLPASLALLKELVEIESPSNNKAAVDHLGQRIIHEMEVLQGQVQVFEQDSTGNHIRCRWGEGPNGILLLFHMDTVFNLGTLARQPFREEAGKCFGPGISDMKASIAMLLTVIRLFQEKSLRPSRPITALFTSDEETGSLTSRPFIEREAQQAGIVFCMEPALASGAVKTARKGTGDIDLRVKGVSAHAGIDHARGRNAIEELAYHILDAQKLTDYSQGTTVNVGVVSGGTRGNVVPDEAQAFIDFRISSMDAYDRLEAWANNLKPVIDGVTLTARIDLNRPPMPRNATMAQTYEKAQRIANQFSLTLTEGSTGGGSDANFVAPLGIPVLDGLGAVGDGAHSDREFIWVHSMAERAALLANLMLNW